jgi:hypothetical protein
MPIINIKHNGVLNNAADEIFFRQIVSATAEHLHKPAEHVHVFENKVNGYLNGSSQPSAFIEIRMIEALETFTAKALSNSLGEILYRYLGIEKLRINIAYIQTEKINAWRFLCEEAVSV